MFFGPKTYRKLIQMLLNTIFVTNVLVTINQEHQELLYIYKCTIVRFAERQELLPKNQNICIRALHKVLHKNVHTTVTSV
jgi:hypothetical protein